MASLSICDGTVFDLRRVCVRFASREGKTKPEIMRCSRAISSTDLPLPDAHDHREIRNYGVHDHDELAPGVWTWLQAWYATQCDGDWEHEYGIQIETLDNPGWSVSIDLGGTALSGMFYERQELHRSEHEWVITWVEKDQFRAACGPLNLGEALHLFRRWTDATTPGPVQRLDRKWERRHRRHAITS